MFIDHRNSLGFFGLFSLLSPSFEFAFINVMKSMLLLVVFFACSLYFLSKSQIYETFECSALEGNKKRKSFKENGHFFLSLSLFFFFFLLIEIQFRAFKKKSVRVRGISFAKHNHISLFIESDFDEETENRHR